MSNLFKKVTSTVSVVAIIASAVSSSLVAAAGSSFAPYADALATAGIIGKQSTEAGYNLGNNVTRAEMAKVAVNLKKAEVKECTGKVFSDVTSKLGDLCGYVEAAAEAGLVNKTSATAKFRPMDLVTRAEALKMLLSAKGIAASTEDQGFKDLGTDASLNGYINAAAKAGIVNKGTSFNPNGTATRGEAFKIAANAAGLTTTAGAEAGDDLNLGDLFGDNTATGATSTGVVSTGATSNNGSTVVTAAGDLNVALNPKSPSSGTQVPMAGIVKFATVDLSAGGSDISVASLEIKKAGLSTVSSSVKVWFEKNGIRISGKSSFTSESNAIISFAPAFVVKAGTTESVELYVQLADTLAGTDYQFVSGTVTATAKNVAGSFTTPVLRTANYSVATFQASRASSTSTYKASNDVIELGAFKIAATKPNTVTETRDEKFKSVSLSQSGTANLTNLSNIILVRDGVTVSTSAIVDGKTLTFSVNDTIKDGSTATYYIKANVINVENSIDSYQFYLKNTSDLNIVEAASDFRTTADVTWYPTSTSKNPDNNQFGGDASKFVAFYYTVNGGDIKFERDSTVALSESYAPGSDAVLMAGTITAKNAITLENPRVKMITVSSGSANTNISNYFNTLYLQVGSSLFSATATGTAGDYITFDGTVTVTNSAKVKLYGTLKSGTSVPAGTIKFDEMKLENFTGTNQYVTNQNTVDDAVGTISARTITVDATSLNVTRNDGLGSVNLAAGSKGVTLYGVQLSSTKGNPVNVTSATFAISASGSFADNVYATLYVDGVAKSSKTVDSTKSVKFDGFTAQVSSSKSVSLVVKADFSDSFAVGTLAVKLSALAAVDSVSSKDVTDFTKPQGATFTMASADSTVALSDGNPQANLFLAGSATDKLFAFKVTAKNDSVNIKNVYLTGTRLDAFANYKLVDASNNVIATSSLEAADKVSFENISSSAAPIAQDKSVSFYVVADANSNTNTGGVQLFLNGTGSLTLRGSNGNETNPTTVFALSSKIHAVAENTAVVAKATNSSKEITTSALRFTVTANGKNSIKLGSLKLSSTLAGYNISTSTVTVNSGETLPFNTISNDSNGTGNIVTGNVVTSGSVVATVTNSYVRVYKDSVSSSNLAFIGLAGSDKTLTATANNKNTVDAGSSITYIVTVENVVAGVANVTPDWNVSLKDVILDTIGDASVLINASDYYNVGSFPITEVK